MHKDPLAGAEQFSGAAAYLTGSTHPVHRYRQQDVGRVNKVVASLERLANNKAIRGEKRARAALQLARQWGKLDAATQLILDDEHADGALFGGETLDELCNAVWHIEPRD